MTTNDFMRRCWPFLMAAQCVGGAAAVQAEGADVTALENTRWQLESFTPGSQTDAATAESSDAAISMSLYDNGTATLKIGCNQAKGEWQAEDGRFRFDALVSGSDDCGAEPMEADFVKRAERIDSFSINDGKLVLSLMNDRGQYQWRPLSAPAPLAKIENTLEPQQEPERPAAIPQSLVSAPPSASDGGPRVWQVMGRTEFLAIREQASAEAETLAEVNPGSVLDNLGCEQAEKRVWCRVKSLDSGIEGFVPVYSLMAVQSSDGKVITGPANAPERLAAGRIDAKGKLPCAQGLSQPMVHCSFAVARAGGGDTSVVIQTGDDQRRVVHFRLGQPVAVSGKDGERTFAVLRLGEFNTLQVDDERYQIPDTVVWGG